MKTKTETRVTTVSVTTFELSVLEQIVIRDLRKNLMALKKRYMLNMPEADVRVIENAAAVLSNFEPNINEIDVKDAEENLIFGFLEDETPKCCIDDDDEEEDCDEPCDDDEDVKMLNEPV